MDLTMSSVEKQAQVIEDRQRAEEGQLRILGDELRDDDERDVSDDRRPDFGRERDGPGDAEPEGLVRVPGERGQASLRQVVTVPLGEGQAVAGLLARRVDDHQERFVGDRAHLPGVGGPSL